MDIQILCNTNDETLFANIGENSRKHRSWIKMLEAHDGHAVIVGGGPSLQEHLPTIKKRKDLGQTIFALNGAAKFLNENGIIPEYQVILDARPDNIALIGSAKKYLIASQCDPAIFKALGDPFVWHPAIEDIEEHLPAHDDDYALIGGGTTVGLSAMCLAYTLGYRKLHLFGYDSSHRATLGHAYKQPINATEPLCKVTLGGKTFTASLTMARQAELFPEVCNNLIDLGCIVTVDSDGLIMEVMHQMRLASQPLTEEEKYRKMWEFDSYRTMSPGEGFAEEFVKVVKPHFLDIIADFGCGTGRGGLAINRLTNCDVIFVDFADNCLDLRGQFPFVYADLTQPMSMKVSADIGYCTDVMEHIEPEKVPDAIRNIMDCVDKCFFKIAMFHDNMGSLIGHPLHLSVFPVEWWEEQFAGYDVLYRNHDGDTPFPYATFYVKAKERA